MGKRFKMSRLISVIALILVGALFATADARVIFDQGIHTVLSPNTAAVVTFSGDSNDTALVVLQFNGISIWSSSVSSAAKKAQLDSDVTFMFVAFKKGLTVEQTESNGNCMITLNGTIVENGIQYDQTGMNLGMTRCSKH